MEKVNVGRSGARTGFKVFSINTTIRNPKRNIDFLRIFKKYDGEIMDDLNSYKYLYDLVKYGIYRFANIPNNVKVKLETDEELTKEEVFLLIKDNPQATGLKGRVMTQLRALKDQGFLKFEKTKTRANIVKITKLGNDLIENDIDGTITFTRAMLGMQAKSPIRTSLYNRSVPFLNTIFVINEVNKEWKKLGNTPKGILLHEFGTFVLSMKDCDYRKAANEIINYRSLYRYKVNQTYIAEYLRKNNILELKINSVIR